MASARVLTTIELGATKYEDSKRSNRWPVQVLFKPDPADNLQGNLYDLHVKNFPSQRFHPSKKGGLYAEISLPPGSLTYQIGTQNGQLVSTGGIEVRPPQVPLHKNSSVANLKPQELSGARQMLAKDVPNRPKRDVWPVRFQFGEQTWAVKQVFAVSLREHFQDTELIRDDSGSFSVLTELSEGILSYRFKVIFRENTRADAAPYIRLGWDDASSDPGSLVTWPLRIVVADVGDGAAPPEKSPTPSNSTEKPSQSSAAVSPSTPSVKKPAEKRMAAAGKAQTRSSPQPDAQRKNDWGVFLVGALLAVGSVALLAIGGAIAGGSGGDASLGSGAVIAGSGDHDESGLGGGSGLDNSVLKFGQGQA